MLPIQINLTGTTQINFHNERLADKQDPWTRDIAIITAKRTKTDDDYAEVERLEWFGGLYEDESGMTPGIVLPTRNIRRCLINAAKNTKKGKAIERGLIIGSAYVPVAYEGPRDLEKLWNTPAFRYRTMVKVSRGKVSRMRPCIPKWAISCNAFLLPEAIDLDEFIRIVEFAGVAEGLGDNRVNGYGRFTADVVSL